MFNVRDEQVVAHPADLSKVMSVALVRAITSYDPAVTPVPVNQTILPSRHDVVFPVHSKSKLAVALVMCVLLPEAEAASATDKSTVLL
jgi:hypothetical protein